MLKAEIQPGEAYAIREIRSPGAPLQHIRILQHVRGSKWKAEWIDPNPGLVDYVESKNLIVPWKERKAFLRDEETEKRLEADNASQGYKADSPLDQAITCVFESVGEKGLSYFRGVAEALTIARAFCAAEPATVLVDIEATERKWSLEASRLEGEYLVRLLNEYRAAWALIRQWTGHDPAVAAREGHIQRLERLVLDAIYALQKAGLDSEAHRLRRGLGKD